MKIDSQTYRLTDPGKGGTIALVAGIAGLILSGVGYVTNAEQFFHSWLVAFVFWTTIALGGLCFTMIHHLTGANWSVVIRRLPENLMVILPFMIVFVIPVLFGMHDLFHWTHAEAVENDALLQSKQGYLNVPFFMIRLAGYFVVWFVLSRLLFGLTRRQDNGDGTHDGIIKKMRVVSAPGMFLFAITLTFASFDWLMSLDPHWYSTIFGVYIFSGGFLAMLCFVTLAILALHKNGVLVKEITKEHYHDLAKLIFAFTVFWGYMAFSQYFLIWYGNIPEETVWFLHRWDGTWKTVSLILVFGHFVIPFFLLFPRAPKRSANWLRGLAIWLLLMHWADLYWIVMPTLHKHGVHLSWIDPVTMIGIGGVFVWFFWNRTAAVPLIPTNDPGLASSMKFVNS
ncbi:MAG: hypothetical protein KKA42_02395 [candidate division Zixibacteria bacterium]|nr:hypothetical protein [candidate division Zixibacteria bacterium]